MPKKKNKDEREEPTKSGDCKLDSRTLPMKTKDTTEEDYQHYFLNEKGS